MTKRRTRKDKKNAKHNIKVSWTPIDDTSSNNSGVKRQPTKKSKTENKTKKTSKSTVNKEDLSHIASIKKDILKSLSIAGFILGLELVIYLVL